MVHRPDAAKEMGGASWAAALRGTAEGAAAGALGVLAASVVWREPAQVRAIAMGAVVAWLASSLSTAGLIAGRRSVRYFWWAFGGGIVLRLGALGGLMALSLRSQGLSQPALLLAYVFGVICLLPLEYRQMARKRTDH